jgi:hypothetical protein
MGAEHRLARALLEDAYRTFSDEVADLALGEWLAAAGGYRSILGLTKHVAGWTYVYRSYAFDTTPDGWDDAPWPRGLRETVDPTEDYAGELLGWLDASVQAWLSAVDEPADLDASRPLHWGDTAPLREIVAMAAGHLTYHAGEINAILAIERGEAWEVGEAVEENHLPAVDHLVRRAWVTDEQAAAYERRLRDLEPT